MYKDRNQISLLTTKDMKIMGFCKIC